MLFKIENCQPSQYSNHSNERLAISNLLISNGQRKNIVILDKEAITQILESDSYDSFTKGIASEIDKSRREYSSITKELIVYGVVDFTFKGIQCVSIGDQYVIKIGYDYFVDIENSSSVGLLTEGVSDFDFYSKIANYYTEHISDLGIKVSFKFHFGGGSQCKMIFDRLTSEGRLVLCLIDNDKSHPSKGIGSTSKLFDAKDQEYNNQSLVYTIDVREIETLLPLNIIEKVLTQQNDIDQIETLDEVKTFSTESSEFRKFFDHKEGLNLKKAIELDHQYGEFWLNILSSNYRFNNMECFKDKKCYDCGNCPQINGFGNKILKRVDDNLNTLNLRNPRTITVDSDILPYWKTIGKLMSSWGCIPNTRIVRSS